MYHTIMTQTAPAGSPYAPLTRVPTTADCWFWLIGTCLSTLIARAPSVLIILLFALVIWILTCGRKEGK